MKNQAEIIQQVQSFDPSLAAATVKFAVDDTLEIYPSDEQNFEQIKHVRKLSLDRDFFLNLKNLGVAQVRFHTADGEKLALNKVEVQLDFIDVFGDLFRQTPMTITVNKDGECSVEPFQMTT